MERTAALLTERGLDPQIRRGGRAGSRSAALHADEADLRMWQIGVDMAARLLAGRDVGPVAIAEIQQRMGVAVAGRESSELRQLRADAAALEGKRGEKTAQKRVEEQERREVRRAMTTAGPRSSTAPRASSPTRSPSRSGPSAPCATATCSTTCALP